VTNGDVLRIVGIDDWAWRKGQHHFGTILVDLERRRVVDVLSTRAADAVATWLAACPGIRTISRDRHGPYAEGIRRGAPQAREVADRFHLVSNLRDAVAQELGQQRRSLVVPHRPSPRMTVPREGAASRLVGGHHRAVFDTSAVEHERHAVRLERFQLSASRRRVTARRRSCAKPRSVGNRC
jgi:transposase